MNASSDSTTYGFASIYASLPEPRDQGFSSRSSEPVRYAGPDDPSSGHPSETPLDMRALRRRRRVNLPRFLFRAFNATSGGFDEISPAKIQLFTKADGTSKLNSERRITPHAFVVGKGHRNVTEIRDPKKMVFDHIFFYPGLSEFSSWTPSLLLVFSYAEWLYRRSGQVSSHVCMIDTELIRNSTYSVPDILQFGMGQPTIFPHEYLVHGIVKGAGFVALEWSTIRSLVFHMYPEIQDARDDFGFSVRQLYFPVDGSYITRCSGELERYVYIARQFGKRHFILPLIIKLYCLRRRWPEELSPSLLSRDQTFRKIARRLSGPIRRLTVQQRGILEKEFYTNYGGFEEMRQAQTMTKALLLANPRRSRRLIRREARRVRSLALGSAVSELRRRRGRPNSSRGH